MNTNPTAPLTSAEEALVTQWLDGVLPVEQQPALDALLRREPSLAMQNQDWPTLRNLMQAELPRELTPPSPQFFTSQILREIESPTASSRPPVEVPSRSLGWWQTFRGAWFMPTAAAAAAVAVTLMLLPKPQRGNGPALAAGPYSPDPNVKPTLVFHEEANATVLDLENLKMGDSVEIRPFSVASAPPQEPGLPQRFYAAHDPSLHLFTLGWDGGARPVILAANR